MCVGTPIQDQAPVGQRRTLGLLWSSQQAPASLLSILLWDSCPHLGFYVGDLNSIPALVQQAFLLAESSITLLIICLQENFLGLMLWLSSPLLSDQVVMHRAEETVVTSHSHCPKRSQELNNLTNDFSDWSHKMGILKLIRNCISLFSPLLWGFFARVWVHTSGTRRALGWSLESYSMAPQRDPLRQQITTKPRAQWHG